MILKPTRIFILGGYNVKKNIHHSVYTVLMIFSDGKSIKLFDKSMNARRMN